MLLLMPHDNTNAQEVTSPASKRVLLLNEPGPEFPFRSVFEKGFQSVLRSGQPGGAEYYSETLESYRFPSDRHTLLMRDYLRRKYAGMKFDVIAVWPEAALEFMLRYRDELFPGVPIVYIAVKRPVPSELPHDVTGIWIGPKISETLELALNLHPTTEQVFVVMGTLKNSGLLEGEAHTQLKEFEGRVRLNYLLDLPLDEILTKVKNLPERSIILYVRQTRGVGNKSATPFEAATLIAQSSNAPVYGIIDTWIGSGIVGGKVPPIEWQGAELAKMALRVANGTRPEDIPVEEAPTVPMFDWRQLRRFHISEDRLPAGSIVSFKEFTFWELYKGRIIGVSAILVLQTLLLAGLLFERARKVRASRRLAESEERFAKAFEANPQPMSITTFTDGEYLDVNESFLAMTGFAREEVIGHTSSALRNYENASDRQTLLIEPLLRSGVVRNFELNFRTKNGAVCTLLSSAELLELAGEKCILLASSDITERKSLEQELQRSEREFSTLVENSPDVIARVDRDLRYIYISAGLERATGVSTDRFIGKTPAEIALEGYDWNGFEAACQEAFDTQKTIHRASEYGGRNYWTRIVPEFTSDGRLESAMTISEDVTERVRAEQELVQLTAQLFRLQDEERRKIARELHDGTAQNLFAISVNLAKVGQLDPTQKEEMQTLVAECISLGDESLQEIRTLSYLLHPPLLEQVGLVGALQWYVEGFSKRSGIYVDVFAEPMERLTSDLELALFRIVQEALTNIRRHSGSETASIRLKKSSGEIFLEVQDRGHGLAVAKPSADPEEVGMGVGIPGMRQRLHQLGGRLEIASNAHGATITAIVPLTNGAHHVANPSRGRS
jgi:PAS domain S-box-containing protein